MKVYTRFFIKIIAGIQLTPTSPHPSSSFIEEV